MIFILISDTFFKLSSSVVTAQTASSLASLAISISELVSRESLVHCVFFNCYVSIK